MSIRNRGLLAIGGAFVVAGVVLTSTAIAYETTDNRVPSPVYRSTNAVAFNTAGGLYHIDSFFDVFTDLTRIPPPPPGSDINSFFDVFTELSFQSPGLPPMPVSSSVPRPIRLVSLIGLPSGESEIETEMLALELTGGGLPAGVRVRESPTRASLGRTHIRELGGGQYHIDSFFDVFTELSIDGGATWVPANGPLRLRGGVPEPGSAALLLIAGGMALATRRRGRKQ